MTQLSVYNSYGQFSPPLTNTNGGIIGVINGTNKTFTLSSTPFNPLDLRLYLNGIYFVQGIHYTLSGSVITMTNAPTGGTLVAY